MVQGVYQFQLKVTDNTGATGLDTMQVIVNAPPISNAGADQLITLPANTVSLKRKRNRRRWNNIFIQLDKDFRPLIGYNNQCCNTASTTVTSLVQGVYQFQLKVTDNTGATGLDTMQVIVNAPPVSNAGADQLINLPANSVSLTGSGTDADGTISSYNWTKISGPSSGTITNANALQQSVTSLVQGVYQFQLKVTDNKGAIGLDTMQVTVNAPPVSNAGA